MMTSEREKEIRKTDYIGTNDAYGAYCAIGELLAEIDLLRNKVAGHATLIRWMEKQALLEREFRETQARTDAIAHEALKFWIKLCDTIKIRGNG